MNPMILDIEKEHMKTDVPEFNVGDTVDVKVRIKETVTDPRTRKTEVKVRVQAFRGVVIRRKGYGIRETFTVRRIVASEGVERTFPLHCPNVVGIEVKRRGKVRRAKLYYLRDRVGKAAKVKELLVFEKKSTDEKKKRRGKKGKRGPAAAQA